MEQETSDGHLLVPIANPETVDRLLDTAIDIAREKSLPILAFHVVEVPAQVPLSEGEQLITDEATELLEYVDEVADETDVEIKTRFRYARDTAIGISGSVTEHNGAAILIGWRGRPRRRDIVLGSFLDHVISDAQCDVYVKRIKEQTGTVDAILVPVAGGPHDELAAELGGMLATQHNASVTLLHIIESAEDGADNATADELLEDRRSRIHSDHSVETVSKVNDDVHEAIIHASEDHDLTILGATRDPFLSRKIVGSVAQSVGREATNSVIVTRKYVE